MLLFREIYGWLRYLVAKDPLCAEQGIVVEEMFSTFAPLSDSNDGVRTLAIHRIKDGMTPRLEYRAIGLHPQIYWYPAGASEGSLVAVSNQFGFPGDYKSWDCSTTCQWLLALVHDKFCACEEESEEKGDSKQVNITIAPVTAKKTLDYPVVRRIIDSVIRSLTHPSSTKVTRDMINGWLKKNQGATDWDFALSVMHWFDKGKISSKDIDYLEDEYLPGRDIIDWSWLKRQLNDPERLNKLTPEMADRVLGAIQPMSVEKVKDIFDSILKRFTEGKSTPINATADQVRFGMSAIGYFKAGAIPYQYLQQLELCDPSEKILPWSFIRRNILGYTSNKVHADIDAENLVDLIVKWLKDSHLLLLLYKGDPKQEEALTKALEAQLGNHINQTLENDFWMRSLLAAIPSEPIAEMKKALQVDFDLWLLDALSPAISQSKLPLSPHAFSVEQKDQTTYNKMYKAWEKAIKSYLKGYRDESGKRLTDAISKFYDQAVSFWKTDELKDYKAKIPSASKILNAVEQGDQEGLLTVLCEDFEHEVGSEMPSEIKTKLLSSPYFNAIGREVKLQGLMLD